MRYFERQQVAMYEKLEGRDSYRPGDIVAWDLGSGVLHIGIVSDKALGGRPFDHSQYWQWNERRGRPLQVPCHRPLSAEGMTLTVKDTDLK